MNQITIETLREDLFSAIHNPHNHQFCNRFEIYANDLTVARLKKSIDLRDERGYLHLVPGQRHPDKTVLSVTLPRELMQQLKNLAKNRDTTVTEIVEYVLWRETKDITLTDEDYEQIKKERQAYIDRIDRRRKGNS